MIEQLGYLGFGVSDLGAWETFMTKVLGLSVAQRLDNGGATYRMDSFAQRFLVQPDPSDDVQCVGWQVKDAEALDAIAQKLKHAGVTVSAGNATDCALRKVQALIRFRDPGDLPVEIFYGAERTTTPFKSDAVGSRFIADDLGLGHLVISTKNRDQSRDFYVNVLGFKLSDYIICDIGTYHVDICFLHCNPRHHSLAMGGPMPKKMHHFMLQVANMDDVGLAYDRARDNGIVIENELGRHPNDRMFSFYAQTPSAFQFEFGWDGREIDDATWSPTTYHQISEWGHRRPPRKKPQGETK